MRKLVLLLALLCAKGVWAQQSVIGNITASSTVCASTTTCISLALPGQPAYSGASVTLAGTFSATLQPEMSGDGGVTWVSNGGTLTSAGLTQFTFTGITNFRVRCTAYVSGTVTVTIQGQLAGTGGGGGSSGSAQNAAGTAGPNPQFARYTFYVNGTTTYARNNSTGNIDYLGSDACAVGNSVFAASASTGAVITVKQGIYNGNALTLEGTGTHAYYYCWGIPSSGSSTNEVEWRIYGEGSIPFIDATAQNTGTILNITATGVSSAPGSSTLVGIWQRPNVSQGFAGDVFVHDLTVQFPSNQYAGVEYGINLWNARTVGYENVEATFNQAFPGSLAPTAGSVGVTTSQSEFNNFQDFKNVTAMGYDTCFDFESEHVTAVTVTGQFCNHWGKIGSNLSGGNQLVYHPIVIQHMVDQENVGGLILGSKMAQGSRVDILGMDLELATTSCSWYCRTSSVPGLFETNQGYSNGFITYTVVTSNAGIASFSEFPASSMWTQGGTGFQMLEGTVPNQAIYAPVSDTFTRPNNASSCGPSWLVLIGTCAISSNAENGGALAVQAYYAGVTPNGDQFARATLGNILSTNLAGVMVRVSSTGNYYRYVCSTSGGFRTQRAIQYYSANAFVSTVVQTAANSGCNASGDTLELDAIGSTLVGYYCASGSACIVDLVGTDTNLTTGFTGIVTGVSSGNNATFTNFLGGSLPTKIGSDSIYSKPAVHPQYLTQTNCAAVGTAASPSVASCGSAAAGQFSCATNATGATCTVNTTAVTANSEIFVFDSDTTVTGTRLGVTCNTSTAIDPASRLLASSVAGTSFTINLGTITTNPACFSYNIIN